MISLVIFSRVLIHPMDLFITALMIKKTTIPPNMLLLKESKLEQDHLRHDSMQLLVPNSSQSLALNVNRSQSRAPATGLSYAHYRYGDSRRKQPQMRPNPKNHARDSQRQANLTHHHNPSTVVDPSWYFDNGATDHVAPDLQKFNLAKEYHDTDKLQVGDGNPLAISHIGSSFLHPNLKLSFVLIVPHITKHLLSVSKLTNDNEYFPTVCDSCQLGKSHRLPFC
uniref:Retrovirus-related Pol polyprotein from transposon TNT 1-94-like beta-barrel domain-containing protein n=1 Tax=Lactuca sativa TaxID=4236 RepID=A0A9R1WS94_LACSA|nr:hypothetical protein LSAT_V11C100012160 [Lactuca sativa]